MPVYMRMYLQELPILCASSLPAAPPEECPGQQELAGEPACRDLYPLPLAQKLMAGHLQLLQHLGRRPRSAVSVAAFAAACSLSSCCRCMAAKASSTARTAASLSGMPVTGASSGGGGIAADTISGTGCGLGASAGADIAEEP